MVEKWCKISEPCLHQVGKLLAMRKSASADFRCGELLALLAQPLKGGLARNHARSQFNAAQSLPT
ncbi:MAG: hypothetical protein A2815_00495 [Candidatus Portnoybacteria bacterium RIFCSPHIGHO2_01_FULL_40_12b]|uniref:Uncharacterized protein n=1 Tax=Candidatus Portnoybacteria bacterium RIFCSPHIGHO2_01_FULL_40_12b TaxID=1801994 RepID=A0A1G2FCQ2_9BACT|nr:MAG: hypothetical protein A2815_00495 [Candidatus Portnoybacteria bacterium RIFCSPHIGHO2_01_FULL_40_12b]